MCKLSNLKIEMNKLSQLVGQKMEDVICFEDLKKDIGSNLHNICNELSNNLLPGKKEWIDDDFFNELCSINSSMSLGRQLVSHHIDLMNEHHFCFYTHVKNKRKIPLFSICINFKDGVITPFIIENKKFEGEGNVKMFPGNFIKDKFGVSAIAIQKEFETVHNEYWELLIGEKIAVRHLPKSKL